MEERARMEAELMELLAEQERRAAEGTAREWAPERNGFQSEYARRNSERRREERRAARREARRVALENRERVANNPRLPRERAAPRQWRNIALLGGLNEQNVYAEEMIDVDAGSWHLEEGEAVEVIVNFANPLTRDTTLRLTALAMELTARQLEDDVMANLI